MMVRCETVSNAPKISADNSSTALAFCAIQNNIRLELLHRYARPCARIMGFYFFRYANSKMAGRKNRGMLRILLEQRSEPHSDLDTILDEMLALRLPWDDEEESKANPAPLRVWRLPKAERPPCGAKTRKDQPCQRQALKNGRCPNHGGLSTGPKTKAGRVRIGMAQKERWKTYRAMKSREKLKA